MNKVLVFGGHLLAYLEGVLVGRVERGEAGDLDVELIQKLREVGMDDKGKEIQRLRNCLAVATQATTCAGCGLYKHTPWRDDDGYICAGCLGKQRDEARAQLAQLSLAIPAAPATCQRCGGSGVIETGNNDLPCDCPAGATAMFNVAGVKGPVAGAKLRDHRCCSCADPLAAEVRAGRARIAELAQARDKLLDAVDKDATGLSRALAAIKQTITGFSWVTESRGPYAWDDARYKKETYMAFQAVLKILEPALAKSGDIANQAWRDFERGRVWKLGAEIRRLRDVAKKFGAREHIGMHGGCDEHPDHNQDAAYHGCTCGADEHNAQLAAELASRVEGL